MPESELIYRLLRRDEGFRGSVYQDSEGYWTIGYGRLVDSRKGGKISLSEGEMLLKADVESRKLILADYFPWVLRLDEVRRTVLLSMSFQLGMAGLGTFKNTLKAVKEGRYEDAAKGTIDQT